MKSVLVESAVPGAHLEPRADRVDSGRSPDRAPETMVVMEVREIDLEIFADTDTSVAANLRAIPSPPCDQPRLLDIEIWFG